MNVAKLKLISHYFVAHILGRQRKRKNESVDAEWIRLIDDWESFNFEEKVYGLRKDFKTNLRSYTNLFKRCKNDPDFSGFGIFHFFWLYSSFVGKSLLYIFS